MIRRIFALFAIVWFAGFVWFAIALPGPMTGPSAAAVIVPTGAAGRIEHGLELLAQGKARQMLVTGVDRDVKPAEFAAQFGVAPATMECCITLGYRAVDTRGNAAETADWIKRNQVTSIRLVTTDWHMRRAATELRRTLPPSVALLEDAVPSEPSLRILFVEYHKLLASRAYGYMRG